MERPERKSSVLVAAQSDKTASQIKNILPGQFGKAAVVTSITAVKQKLQQTSIDILILYLPLQDTSDGVQPILEIQNRYQDIGILLLVPQDVYEQTVYRTGSSGIYVMSRPISSHSFVQSLTILETMRQRIKALESRNEKLEKKLEDEKYIGRAKCLLIERDGMKEADAHKYLERVAMDNSITKREVAIRVIRESGRIIVK